MKTNTTNTSPATLDSLLTLAKDPSMQSAEAAHEIWLEAKRSLDRDTQLQLWAQLKELRGGKNDFSGKPWAKAHPDAPTDTPPWVKAPAAEKHPVKAPSAPAKQEKPAKAKAPAKQEKPAKAAAPKEPTQKQMLANICLALDGMDKRLAKLDKRMDSLDKRMSKLEKSAR